MSDRNRVAVDLAEHLASQGLDDPWSEDRSTSTRWRYSDDGELYEATRLQLHSRLIETELAKKSNVSKQGNLGVIVTAGPPGAGKSTALRADRSLETYRDVDADSFKDALLIWERNAGTLDGLSNHVLPDGNPVAPREIASFVHAESTTVAAAMRERCLANGENIIVHGTLASSGYTDELLQQLDRYSYSRLVIYDVETSVENAIEQALSRWWTDRQSNAEGLGGRFVAPEAIRRHYAPGEVESRCAQNAADLHDRARRLGWSVDLRRI